VAAPVSFEQRMSDQEALMWALELDPVLRSSFANVTFLDRPADPERFRDRMRLAVEAIPRLRQRVGEAGPGLATPSWVDDGLFDLDFHVRTVAVPAPFDERAVLDLAAVLSADPFDRGRPLWQFTLVEGLEGGRGAMIQKLHHSITDGEGGLRLSASFLDAERDAPEPLIPMPSRQSTAPEARSISDVVRESVTAGMRLPLDLARQTVAGTVETLTHPSGAPGRAGDAVETARSVMRQLAVTEPARSPLWTERSLRRRIEVLTIPLEEAKSAAGRLGGTVNDWFVTGAVGAAGAYHRRCGSEVDELRMAMPVSTRAESAERSSGTNSFAPTRLLVPAGIEDPVARFDAVQAALRVNRAEKAVGSIGRLAGLLSVLPTTVLARVARQQVGTVDFTTSNVRGASFPLYIAGSRIEANHPLGPLAGTAFNLTTLSSAGNLDMGCLIDTGAVSDPELLRSCLLEAYDELRTAAR
jgi:WS/DGAT/MGAT family acyltransferase